MSTTLQELDPRESQLRQFVLNHHEFVNDYHRAALNPILQGSTSSIKCRLEWLMLSALDAAGKTPRVDHKAETMGKFRAWTDNMLQFPPLTFEKFSDAGGVSEKQPELLVAGLRKKLMELKQIKAKKADLFLRDLVIHLGPKLFERFDPKPFVPHLRVPVDTVQKQLFGLFHGRNTIQAIEDADIWNWSARVFRGEPIKMDDLWFWGHFSLSTKKPGKRRQSNRGNSKELTYRILQRNAPNVEMIATDRTLCLFFSDKHERVAALASEFIEIMLGTDQESTEILINPAPKKQRRKLR